MSSSLALYFCRKPQNLNAMGIFNYDEELASIRNDVSTLKRQMEGLLATRETNSEPPQEPQIAEVTTTTALAEEPVSAPPPTETTPTQEDCTLSEAFRNLAEKIDTAAYQEGIIRDLHHELQQLKKGLLESISRTYAMDIVNIYERICDTNAHFDLSAESFDAASVKRLLENNILYISDLLEDEYSIEKFEPQPGSDYKPKEQKAIRTVDTDDEAKSNTVAECHSAGFRDMTSGRTLRQARVTVYKLKERD